LMRATKSFSELVSCIGGIQCATANKIVENSRSD
jgi:hypothetical protein